MADIEKTISIIFGGVDEVSGTIKTVGQNLDDFSKNVSGIADPLANIGKGVLALEGAFATLASGAIAMAVKQSAGFHDSISEINTLLNLSSADLGKYSSDILAYAQDSTQSMEQITQSLYNASSLSVQYADTLDVLSAAEKLAVGGKAELNDALETLVGTMNAYGAPMSQITAYSDAFFTIIRDGKTTLPELSQSIADATAIAAAAGVDFDTLGAAIAAMTAAGVPTSQAITKVRSAIEALLTPTPAASKAAIALGVDLSEAALKSKGFPVVLQEIYEKTGGSAEKMSGLITSTEALQAAIILGADKSGIFAKALEDMASKTGATETAFKEMADNTSLVWQNMANNWEVMLIKFGEKLESNSGSLIGAFAELWKSVSAGVDDGTFDPVLDAINQMLDGADEQIKKLAENLPEALEGVDFSGFIESIHNLKNVIFELFGIDLSDKNSLEKTLQNLVDTLEGLTNTSAAIIKAFDPIADLAGDLIEWFGDLDDGTQRFIGTVLGISIIVSPLATVGAAAAGMITAFAGIATAVAGVGGLTAALAALGGPAIVAGIAGVVAVIGVQLYRAVSDSESAVNKLVASVKDYAGATGNPHLIGNLDELEPAAVKTAGAIGVLHEYIKDLPDEVKTKIMATYNDKGVELALMEVDDYKKSLGSIPADVKTDAKVELDEASVADTKAKIGEAAPDNLTTNVSTETNQPSVDSTKAAVDSAAPPEKTTTAVVNPDQPALDKTKAAIDTIPTERMMEIQLKGDIDIELARIKADAEAMQTAMEWEGKLNIAQIESQTEIAKAEAETVQTAFEWTGKLNIAAVEADAKKVVAAFESVASAVASTSSAASDMFSSLLGNWDKLSGGFDRLNLMNMVQQQLDMEREALEIQRNLTEAQIEYMQAKSEALTNGEGLINISSDGLEPALETIMWQILEKVQLRATEEAAEFLLGLGAT